MTPESGIELQFTGLVSVTPDYTYAVYVSDFTERLDEILDARERFSSQHRPTTMEFHREVLTIEEDGVEVKYPVLIWDVNLVHGQATNFPQIKETQEDRVPAHPLDEYEVYIAE